MYLMVNSEKQTNKAVKIISAQSSNLQHHKFLTKFWLPIMWLISTGKLNSLTFCILHIKSLTTVD